MGVVDLLGVERASLMEPNLGTPDRITRGVLGVVLLCTGLSIGRRSWWAIVFDGLGALLLISAATGFCHVYKTFGVSTAKTS